MLWAPLWVGEQLKEWGQEALRGSLGDVYCTSLGMALTQQDVIPRIKIGEMKALAVLPTALMS